MMYWRCVRPRGGGRLGPGLVLWRTLAICLAAAGSFAMAPRGASAAEPANLWVYVGVNFQVDKSTDDLLALLRRAKAAGYSAAVVTDYKFGKIDDRPDRYYKNLRRAREAAAELGVELIPCVMPIGYSGSILQNNPHLAAGLPVRDQLFEVAADRRAMPIGGDLFSGGAMEQAQRDRPAGWSWVDGFGTSTRLDTAEKHGGKSSLRMTNFRAGNEHGNCRLVFDATLEPWRAYRVSFWAKTKDLDCDEFRVLPLVNGRSLNHASPKVAPTQDWTRHAVVFNSLEHTQVKLYIGLWEGRGGTVWLDDLKLEPVGGVNLLRRDGCPLKVASEDGAAVYTEGVDFARWEDPRLGNDPYLGEYTDDHDGPALVIPPRSAIRPGQRLKVSYYHTVIVHEDQVCCELVHDALFPFLKRQVELLDGHWKPKRYFMQHDEIRVGGHDAVSDGRPAGELLAENARRCVETIRAVNPKAEIVVWSDMFDPLHNAVDNYYLVRGSLKNSWLGLPPEVGIVNWNGGKARDSLAWFAGRGHRQVVAGYYDGDVAANVAAWRKAAAGVQGVDTYMYTTWRGNYRELERFSQLVREAQ